MAVTGHSTEKNLRRYLKMQLEEQASIAYDNLGVFLEYEDETSSGIDATGEEITNES